MEGREVGREVVCGGEGGGEGGGASVEGSSPWIHFCMKCSMQSFPYVRLQKVQ